MGAGLESLEAMGKWVNIRAVDTDPHGFAWSRIYFPSCVLIQDGKIKGKKQEKCKKIGNNRNFIKNLNKFGPAPWFYYFFSNLFFVFQLQ